MKRRIILGTAIVLAITTLIVSAVSKKESSARPSAPGSDGPPFFEGAINNWSWREDWDWRWFPDYGYVPYPTDNTTNPTYYDPFPTDNWPYPTDNWPYPSDTYPYPNDSWPYPTDYWPYPTDYWPYPTDYWPYPTDYTTGQTTVTLAPTQAPVPTLPSAATSKAQTPTLPTSQTAKAPTSTLSTTVASASQATQNQADTFIELSDGNISINGPAAQVYGNTLVITGGGNFHVKGALSDGMIYVSAGADDKVNLILSGVKIENKSGAAIYAPQADKLNITLESDNVLTDGGANYQYADAAAEEPNAALYAKCDIKFDGDGKLTVNAGFNNGISTSDDIDVKSGTIVIEAKNHGMRGKDSVNIKGGNLKITTSEGDAITATATGDDTKGWIKISDGVLSLNAGRDAVQAETTLEISGGEFEITTAGGSAAASRVNQNESYKALKAKGDILISAGKFNVDSADDAVHTNANLTVTGGDFQIKTGDDGMHADNELKIEGGNIKIPTCYEGIEGSIITINNGDIDIVSSDDAINAAGGASNGGNGGGRFPGDQFAPGNHAININGGNIKLYSSGNEGDGLDANGVINMTGGFVVAFVAYPTNGSGGIDADKAIVLKGGTIIASNITSMVSTVIDPSSSQAAVHLNTNLSAGADVVV
jgi:hypothetical protein